MWLLVSLLWQLDVGSRLSIIAEGEPCFCVRLLTAVIPVYLSFVVADLSCVVLCLPLTAELSAVLFLFCSFWVSCVGVYSCAVIQDLKDYMRSAGEVTYAEAHNRGDNQG